MPAGRVIDGDAKLVGKVRLGKFSSSYSCNLYQGLQLQKNFQGTLKNTSASNRHIHFELRFWLIGLNTISLAWLWHWLYLRSVFNDNSPIGYQQ